MPRFFRGFFSALVRHQAFFVLVLLGTFIGVGLQFSGTQPLASAAETCTNAICVPAGDAAQWRAGNLILNTGNAYANGLLVPYGNVGIGTTDTVAKLHVGGDAFFRDKVSIGVLPSVDSATQTPEYLLEVGGKAKFSGICLGDRCISSWDELSGSGGPDTGATDGEQVCGPFFGADVSACAAEVKNRCCANARISSCRVESGTGGDTFYYKASGSCDAPRHTLGQPQVLQRGAWNYYQNAELGIHERPATVGNPCSDDWRYWTDIPRNPDGTFVLSRPVPQSEWTNHDDGSCHIGGACFQATLMIQRCK